MCTRQRMSSMSQSIKNVVPPRQNWSTPACYMQGLFFCSKSLTRLYWHHRFFERLCCIQLLKLVTMSLSSMGFSTTSLCASDLLDEVLPDPTVPAHCIGPCRSLRASPPFQTIAGSTRHIRSYSPHHHLTGSCLPLHCTASQRHENMVGGVVAVYLWHA